MYKIKVLKRGKVILGDLGLTLKHGDILDLEERFPRSMIDASTNLRIATSGDDPHIAILHRDVEKGTDPSELLAMEERIKRHMADHMKATQPAVTPAPAPDITSQLLEALKHLQAPQPTPAEREKSTSTERVLQDDKLVDIHKRAIERLTKNTEGHVSSEQKNIQSDAAKHAKDLEDMF